MAYIQSQILMQARNFYSWDIKAISQQKIISPRQRLVGETTAFKNQILFPLNCRRIRDDSIVISLQYLENETVKDSWFLLFISAIKAHLRWRYRKIVVRVITDDL